jgi:hypothetical protein
MSYHKINIVLSFNDIEELEQFTKDYRGILHKRAKKFFKCDDDELLHTKLMPILSGMLDMQNKNIAFQNSRSTATNTFNIFGHTPIGFSPVIKVLKPDTMDYMDSSDKNIILMNLDNSNTFHNMNLNLLSKSHLEITNDNVQIKSTIIMNLQNLNLQSIKNLKYSTLPEKFDNKCNLYISNDFEKYVTQLSSHLRIVFNNNDVNVPENLNFIREYFSHTNVFYHGIIDLLELRTENNNIIIYNYNNNSNYFAFTVNTREKETGKFESYKKYFYILSIKETIFFFQNQ